MHSVLQSPARYTQGKNATDALGAELTQLGLGGPALIVASPTPIRLLSETWETALTGAGIAFEVERFGGECSNPEITRIDAIAADLDAQVIIGVGGGKTLDTSRAVASDLDVATVNCPTVASSDAPCSALSVLYSVDGEFAEYRFYRKNPDLVLVDTAIIAQAPTRLLVAGIGDALATWWEAKAVAQAGAPNQLHGQPASTGTSLARLCYDLLLENGVDAKAANDANVVTPALERLVEANTLLSGLGFESGGLAAAHSIHNGLTMVPETHDYMHGEKVAFGLVTELVLEGQPPDVFDEVLGFAATIGLPITLAQLGITDPDQHTIETIAARSVAEGETIHHEPFAVSAEQVADAIVAADAIGRDRLAG